MVRSLVFSPLETEIDAFRTVIYYRRYHLTNRAAYIVGVVWTTADTQDGLNEQRTQRVVLEGHAGLQTFRLNDSAPSFTLAPAGEPGLLPSAEAHLPQQPIRLSNPRACVLKNFNYAQ